MTCQNEETPAETQARIDEALQEAEAIALSGAEMLDFKSVAEKCREELILRLGQQNP